MREPRDSELLDRARKGDAAAFDTLVRRHDKHLYRIARSVLSDDQEAEDAVQESYIRAFTGLRDFRGAASLRTWLTRIVLNEAIRRRRHRRSTVDLDALHAAQERTRRPVHSSSLTAQDRDPERAAAQSQIRKTLEKAIDNLPAAFRVVLVMRDVEEFSTADTAKLLGIRQETVKTRLHRARRMLRESLGEQLALALKDVFPFEKPRCDALVQRLRGQLGFAGSLSLMRSL
ncbi:MAG TPA: RNA polymerase sigma factor [Xanthobacteraceae bacterium]|nr:RNA polymerase sigma factor [Xanthobacteraceae bacterium]